MASSELLTLEGNLAQFPATILNLLGLRAPNTIPAPMQSIVDNFGYLGYEYTIDIVIHY